jgi:phosphatidate cytidylyltransferase
LSRNLIIRVAVAVIFGPLIILLSYLGGNWLAGMIILLSAVGMAEFLYNEGIRPDSALFWISFIFGVGTAASSIIISPLWGGTIFIAGFLVVGLFLSLGRQAPGFLFGRSSAVVWAMAYLGLLYPFVFYIREDFPDAGGDWLLFLFGTLWLSDTLAMGAGKAIGRRKLAPQISPGKTTEGFVAGVMGGAITALILGHWRLSEQMLPLLLVGGILVSIVGQLGDLVESIWKRSVGAKDSSTIIPGHGGVLDRFDSLLFSAPALYWWLKFVIYG